MSFLLLAVPPSFALFPAFKRYSQRVTYRPNTCHFTGQTPTFKHVITQRYRYAHILLNIILHIRKIRNIITNSYNAYM